MTRADVLIAGGGVIGLMTGWMLARTGADVLVVDSGAPAATNAAAGMLAPSFERSLHQAGASLAAFGEASLARWREIAPLLEERGGVPLDFDQGGVLSVVFDDDDAALFEKDEAAGDYLGRDAVLRLEPSLAPSVAGGRFSEGDAQIDARRVKIALEIALQNDGGRLLSGRSVASISSASGRTTGVLLSDGERIAAADVVIATGARISGIGYRDSGIENGHLPSLFTIPDAGLFYPVKGEALALARIAGAPSRVVRTRRAYLCPKADGRVIVGATEIPNDWSLTTDAARIDALKKGAVFAFPALRGAKELARWAGLRPATKDGAPIIGAAPDGPKGLYFALGHYRNGVLLAPATADAIVRLARDGERDPRIEPFSAGRFSNLGVS